MFSKPPPLTMLALGSPNLQCFCPFLQKGAQPHQPPPGDQIHVVAQFVPLCHLLAQHCSHLPRSKGCLTLHACNGKSGAPTKSKKCWKCSFCLVQSPPIRKKIQKKNKKKKRKAGQSRVHCASDRATPSQCHPVSGHLSSFSKPLGQTQKCLRGATMHCARKEHQVFFKVQVCRGLGGTVRVWFCGTMKVQHIRTDVAHSTQCVQNCVVSCVSTRPLEQ